MFDRDDLTDLPASGADMEEDLAGSSSVAPLVKSKSDTGARAVQIAFELEQRIAAAIREQAAREGLTPSDRIRKLVGLPYASPKRPRLTLSLSDEDYALLAQRYGVAPSDRIMIKKRIAEELAASIEA